MGVVCVVRELSGVDYGETDRRQEETLEAVPASPDLIDDLADEIAVLAAHIQAATHRLLELIARFDRLRGWEPAGHRSCADWLSFRTGIDKGTAREKVRVARALEALPRTSAAMARGELSFSQVRALTRVADADNEADLLELARGTPTWRLEAMVRAWKRGTRRDEAERERERFESRELSVFPDDEGMYIVRGRLTPEVGAVLMRAIEAAGDALYRERRVLGTGGDLAGEGLEASGRAGVTGRATDSGRPTASGGVAANRRADAAAQLRADALGLVAERALAAGFGGAGSRRVAGGGCPDDDVTVSDAPLSGTRSERYQVVLHVDAETLSAHGEPGRSELEDGTRVSGETARRLACDAGVVRVTHGADGRVLDVGRRTRSIPPALRRALEVRDRGCRFPGCGLRFTDGHHVEHWADGGATSLDNCLLLCRHHHRLVHEGGWRIDWWGRGRAAFVDPRGGAHFDGGWEPPRLGERMVKERRVEERSEGPVAALLRDGGRRGVRPAAWTAGARWRTEADIPDDVFLRACEAV